MAIFELSASELREQLDKGELTSFEIVEALQARADEINDSVVGFVSEFREDALKAAHESDERRRAGESLGLLDGLPLSVKDNINVRGRDSTLGFRVRKTQPASEDAVIVRRARELGAVFLGKTNVPQTLLSPLETTNHIFGTSKNPWNVARAPGGSSGGEAVAIATGMSPIGFGSDVGGSIRLPAAMCGVVGFKPTNDRWSNHGCVSVIPGQEFVRAQTGPMARTVDDVELLYRALCETRQWELDPRVPPVPLEDPQAVNLSNMRIGFYESDGFLEPSPGAQRAVREAVRALESAGATLVEYRPVAPDDVLYLHVAAMSSDGGRGVDEALAGEEIIEPLKLIKLATEVPALARTVSARGLELMGEGRTARMAQAIGAKDAGTFWGLTAERTRLFFEEMAAWDASGIDALVCPSAITPAVPHNMSKDFVISLSYAARYNLFNLPAGSVPVTCVRPGEEVRERVRDRIDKTAAAVEENSEGMPMGVQVVGRRWQEHKVLAAMKTIESGVRQHPEFPKTPITPAGTGSIRPSAPPEE